MPAAAGQKERACVAMSEEEVTSALAELSRAGWLGRFTPGRYVFRAWKSGLPADACNPDKPTQLSGAGRPGPSARVRLRR